MAVSPEKVINGTFGDIWVNDDNIAQCTGLEAKVTIEKQEVVQTGTLAKGYKVTGLDCKGTLKLNKINSYFIELLSDNIRNGKSPIVTIVSKLADPDTAGAERIKFTGCTFDEMTLASWEAGKLTEESIPFTFTGWELLDTMD